MTVQLVEQLVAHASGHHQGIQRPLWLIVCGSTHLDAPGHLRTTFAEPNQQSIEPLMLGCPGLAALGASRLQRAPASSSDAPANAPADPRQAFVGGRRRA